MAEDPVVAELRAAAAGLITAAAAAETGDWALAEQSAMDSQARSSRAMREIQLKLVSPPPPVPVERAKPE